MNHQKRQNSNPIVSPAGIGRRFAVARRYAVIIVFTILFLCTAYWLKCQLGINISSSMSVSTHFPFNYLKDDVLDIKRTGTVLYDDFDHFKFFSQWSELTVSSHGMSEMKVIDGGYGENSRCLQISYGKGRYWVCSFSKFISVRKGDVLQFEGLTRLVGKSQNVHFRVVAYDKDRNAIDWRLVVRTANKKDGWVKLEKRFKIEDANIRYIKLQLFGGQGVYRFDNIMLEMV